MKKTMKKAIALLIMTAMMIIPLSAFASFEPSSLESDYLVTIIDVMMRRYKYDLDKAEVYKHIIDYALKKNPELLEGMLDVSTAEMDKFSEYYSADDLEAFINYVEREYVGIGVVIQRTKDGIVIMEVMSGSSAEDAGIKADDIIVAVDGEPVAGMSISDVTSKVRGEAGTNVEITVKRGGAEITKTITRRAVSAGTVAYTVTEDNIGYIKIAGFSSTTPNEIRGFLDELKEKNINKIIFDVRDNPGGELGSCISSLSLVVPKDMRLVTVDYKEQGYDLNIYSSADFTENTRDIVVLINEESASAAELFAGAISSNKIGTTIGQVTYGKGSVQEFLGLRNIPGHNIGDIKMTVAEYLLPNGEAVNKIGIKPDIKVKNTLEDIDTSGFLPLLYDKKYTVGDSGEGVLAIEQRLAAMMYMESEPDEFFDEETAFAVEMFQSDRDLFPYGVADMTTQAHLNGAVSEVKLTYDRQLEKALEILKEKQ